MLETIRGYISQKRINQASYAVGGAIQTVRRGITQLTQNPRGVLSSTIEKIQQAYNTARTWVAGHVDLNQIWPRIQQFVHNLRAAPFQIPNGIFRPILIA